MEIAIVTHLVCRTSGGGVKGCVVDFDMMVRFNTIGVLHLVADHGMVMVLCTSVDCLFSDLQVHNSCFGNFPLQRLRFPVSLNLNITLYKAYFRRMA